MIENMTTVELEIIDDMPLARLIVEERLSNTPTSTSLFRRLERLHRTLCDTIESMEYAFEGYYSAEHEAIDIEEILARR